MRPSPDQRRILNALLRLGDIWSLGCGSSNPFGPGDDTPGENSDVNGIQTESGINIQTEGGTVIQAENQP